MLLIFPWVRIWTVSQFELSGFASIIDQFQAFERFSPVPLEKFLTYEGIIGLTYDEPILILCILVWGISRGSDFVSGELSRGTMEMLLAQPVSRLSVASAHCIVSVIGLAGLVTFAHLGLYLGIVTNSVPFTQTPKITLPIVPIEFSVPFSEPTTTYEPLTQLVAPEIFLPASFNLFGLGMTVLGLGVCISAFDQYRWRTIGLTIGTYVCQLLLFVLGKAAPPLQWVLGTTFLTAYQPDWIIQRMRDDPTVAWSLWLQTNDGINWFGPAGLTLILCGLGASLYAMGVYHFCRRDLPAPL